MIFGDSCCTVQTTFGSQNLNHAEFLYDSLVPLAPIFGALFAATPIHKGALAVWDYRFKVGGAGNDPRSDKQKDPNNPSYIPKGKYCSNNHYISDHPHFAGDKLNDGDKYKINQDFYNSMLQEGVPARLAYHVANILVHTPHFAFDENLGYNPETSELFCMFVKKDWPAVRFRPPMGLKDETGWRIEFRPIEAQLSEFENFAAVTLMNYVIKILTEYDVNLSLPISLNDINMERAHEANAVTEQKFWFRKQIVKKEENYKYNPIKDAKWNYENFSLDPTEATTDDEFVEMTIGDIMNGNPDIGNTGLLQLIREYIQNESEDVMEFGKDAGSNGSSTSNSNVSLKLDISTQDI